MTTTNDGDGPKAPDRRQSTALLTARMDAIEEAMRKNTAMTASNTALIQEVLDIMSTAKAGFRALGWLGVGMRWLGGVAAACAALWALYQTMRHGGGGPTNLGK